ncbi:MAG: hypothetical protein MOB07_00810 [Acidobacteria bacterium]|nr:hypothetical protein [Acidobacteriota bacterium]
MKTAKTTTKLFAMVIALVTAATIWFAWGARRAQAVADSETVLSPIGITFGQTARLSVLNSGESKGIIIHWKFLDSAGRTLARGPEPHLIPTNQFRSFDVNGDELGAERDRFGRIQMRAVVTLLGGPDTRGSNGAHCVSVEVIDNASGKTTFTTKFCTNNL